MKAEKHGEHILSRLRSLMKRERLKEENDESNVVFSMFKMATMLKHCILSCKYGDCPFSCSGKQVRKFEKHLKECWYIPVKCSNKHCLYTSRRHLMKTISQNVILPLRNVQMLTAMSNVNEVKCLPTYKSAHIGWFCAQTKALGVWQQCHTRILTHI